MNYLVHIHCAFLSLPQQKSNLFLPRLSPSLLIVFFGGNSSLLIVAAAAAMPLKLLGAVEEVENLRSTNAHSFVAGKQDSSPCRATAYVRV